MEKKYELWDLKSNSLIEEPIYGEDFLRFCYTHQLGKILSQLIFTKRPINDLYALYKRSRFSSKQIPLDIKKYRIDMSQFEDKSYKNFRDFFLRKFKDGARNFPHTNNQFGAFCEGKYLGYNKITDDIKYPVKGTSLSPSELLQNKNYANFFVDGSILIARLCPADYHYFHFPDSGCIIDAYQIPGSLESVSAFALSRKPEVFCLNERRVNILKTDNFGHLAFIEVGAMVVGRICQTFKNSTFIRGQEKGYFDFGGSTVIILAEKNILSINPKILENSITNLETAVSLGQTIAERKQ